LKSSDSGGGFMSDSDKQSAIDTTAMMKRLFRTTHLKAFLQNHEETFQQTTFSDYIQKLCAEKQLVPEHVIKKSGIDRTYGHQLFNGLRKPSRDKVIQLAFGFPLDVEETQELLKIADKSMLYPKIKRDAVILYCLKNGASFFDAQATLQDLSLPMIGKEGRYE